MLEPVPAPLHPHALRRRSDAASLLGVLGALLLAVAGGACGGGEVSEPGVHFETPEDGAVVESPVQARFGARGVEVGAVPEEVETPRDSVIHYHLGVDTECLPPGTVIPSADPWIHFGDGSDEIEMQLEPGEHRLTVQAGDDEHRTIEGLCQSITVTVEGGS